MTKRDELAAALWKPNVKAFLSLIRQAEGTAGPDGYRMRFGGGTFDGYTDHPGGTVTARSGSREITSSAAGAYQFLFATWREIKDALGLSDFAPPNQDLAAVGLIARRGALQDVLDGRLANALAKCCAEWASLPGSPYGQPTVTIQQARAWFEQAGGRVSDSKDIQRDAPVFDASIRPVGGAKIMSPFILPALEAIVSAVPALTSIFGDKGRSVPERNAAAAVKVVEAAKTALGAANEQAVVETLQSDPAAALAVTKAVQGIWYELTEAGGGGIGGARQFAAEHAEGRYGRVLERVSYAALGFLAFANLAVLVAVVAALSFDSQHVDQLLNQSSILIQADIGAALTALGFWLGSSVSKNRGTQVTTP